MSTTCIFDVSLEAETFKVGEPVRFHFSGNPDFIIFYSGEKGNDYAYKDTDRITDSEMTFSFSTTTTSGTAGNPNPSRVPVCYSTDFSGEYTEEAVPGRHVDRHHRPFQDADRHRDYRSALGRRECHRVLLRPRISALFQFSLGRRTL